MTGIPFNNEQSVGTCGECSGPVVLPIAWWGVIPPAPTCKNCGATARQDYGPTLPMNPLQNIWTSDKIEIDPDAPPSGIVFRTDTERRLR